MIGLLMLAAAISPEDRAFVDQAKLCGIRSDQVIWSTEAEGHRRVDITPNGDPDGFSVRGLMCMLDWGQRTGHRVGFISEPPPCAPKQPPHNGQGWTLYASC